jgi:serine/threonine protein kinase
LFSRFRMTPDRIDPHLIRRLDFTSGELLGQSNQGEVRRFRLNGQELAIKKPKGRYLGWQVRQATLVREYRAYQRLAGLPGFTRCLGLIDKTFLVLEFRQGTPFRRAELADREAFFATLLDIIQTMHAAGVAHGDLKRKDNLLVDELGQPVILDLGAATLRKPGFHPLNQALFDFMCQTDLNAWVKLKYGGYQGISEADQRWLKRSALERVLTRMRKH